MKSISVISILLLAMVSSFAAHCQTPLFKVEIPDSVLQDIVERNSRIIISAQNGKREVQPFEYADCSSLKHIIVEEEIEKIGEYAFLGCTSLESVSLPSSLREIGEGAFRECISLKSLVIPDGVEVIPAYMCAWDESLADVSLPSSVVDIRRNAFS